MKYGGDEAGKSVSGFAQGVRSLGNLADVISASAALEAGFARRDEGWRQQVQAAQDELAELEVLIRGAELRRDIAERSIELHERTVEQTNEIFEMYRDRFTDVGLYSWLSTETQRLYREAYNAAYAAARMAERAFRFEREDDATVSLSASYWDASRAGLRAGERLLIDLQRLERRFIETNYRSLEVDQSFSLLQLDPAALVELRQTGRCEFQIPELAMDLVYPGHFRRRIRSVRLTIPCITGPYTNVSATLRMLDNSVRREPQLGDDQIVTVPLPRTTAIATSTAQNDGGVFEMSFRDERYMPFEGAGAVSRWQLELPANFRQFDYQTINDVIMSIAYTSLEDGVLRQTVEQLNAGLEGSLLNLLSNRPLGRLFSLRQDFSTAFNRLLHSPLNTPVTIDISDKYFPAFLTGRNLDVASAHLIVRTVGVAAVDGFRINLDGADQAGFAADSEFGDLPARDVAAAVAGGIVGEHTFTLENAGGLGPDAPAPGDVSALDEEKIADILLYVETQAA